MLLVLIPGMRTKALGVAAACTASFDYDNVTKVIKTVHLYNTSSKDLTLRLRDRTTGQVVYGPHVSAAGTGSYDEDVEQLGLTMAVTEPSAKGGGAGLAGPFTDIEWGI